ncbi:MAG TPA: hypothetical protein VGS08_02475 [Candidatus Saccharimonadales bacterium]|nr:hypothetical protein [Candidatus Saccharimonadales bacterium]
MNHNNKAMWLIMAGVAVVAIIVASFSRIGGIALLLLICPISMMLMMAFMMKGMGHGDNDHKH